MDQPASVRPHEMVIQRLLEDCRTRRLSGGDRLPSVRELARRYNVAKTTVQQAFGELVRDGLCQVVDRKGLFLLKEPPPPEQRLLTVGLVMTYQRYHEEDNPFYRALFEGAESEAVRGRRNVLSLCDWKTKSPLQKKREVEQFRTQLAGFVALGIYDERDCLRLRESGAPVVAVDYETLDLGIDCVVIENRALMLALAQRVLALDPGEVHYLDLERASDYDPAIVDRRRALEQALKAAGRPVQSVGRHFLKRDGTGLEPLVSALTRPGGDGRRPAVICTDDFVAGKLAAALGPQVPAPGRDFALAYVGPARPQYPALENLPALIGAVDFRELGREGVRQIEARVASGPGRAVRRTVGGEVVAWPGAGAAAADGHGVRRN
jgi:DNA-binding LacI/PurR family transcriptional regulator